ILNQRMIRGGWMKPIWKSRVEMHIYIEQLILKETL
ncbi:MAG: hypothetical protein H6Q68_2622, partial [Firmicutes bacterium]|nr:hypothetical protein [Bacillota bacterium]